MRSISIAAALAPAYRDLLRARRHEDLCALRDQLQHALARARRMPELVAQIRATLDRVDPYRD